MEHGEREAMKKQELVEKIVKAEWEAFDKVQNEGGRASCQNDWNTFAIMRKSQYMTWPEELLAMFLDYFTSCYEQGRNLITEKYGRMEESTAPDAYERIKDAFPVLSEERIALQEGIIAIQVSWMEEFAAKYPNMAGNARSIHTSEDNYGNTSYETYLRGEISTYSEALIFAYGQFIAKLAQEGKNLAYETMNCTAKLYGYRDVDEAERKLAEM